jgi:hypothetical protein
MTIRKRSLVIGLLIVAASVFYGAAKYYSPVLVHYVVEQSLLQKAPSGSNAALIRARLHAFISAAPDRDSQMERLLRISEYLEKLQVLKLEQLDQLLGIDEPEKTGVSRFSRTFSENAARTAGEHPVL